MSASQTAGPGRPLGWWVKQADRHLDALFAQALEGTGEDRRTWQILSSLAAPTPVGDLVAALVVFDPHEAVRARATELVARGWLQDRPGGLHLTPEGGRQRAALGPPVAGVPERVSSALAPQEYEQLVGLLERLVDALAEAEA